MAPRVVPIGRIPLPCPAKGRRLSGCASHAGIAMLRDNGRHPLPRRNPAAARCQSMWAYCAWFSVSPHTGFQALGTRLIRPVSSRRHRSTLSGVRQTAFGSGGRVERRGGRCRPCHCTPHSSGMSEVIAAVWLKLRGQLRYIAAQGCRYAPGFRQPRTDRSPPGSSFQLGSGTGPTIHHPTPSRKPLMRKGTA